MAMLNSQMVYTKFDGFYMFFICVFLVEECGEKKHQMRFLFMKFEIDKPRCVLSLQNTLSMSTPNVISNITNI